MHILFVPRSYPNKTNNISSIFFKEQADAVAELGNFKVGVISVIALSTKLIIKYLFINFKFFKQIDGKVIIYMSYIFSIPYFRRISEVFRFVKGKKLLIKYVQENGFPDIIHLQTYEMGKLAMWIKRKYNVPYIVTEHLSHFSYTMPKWKLKLARKTFENSRLNFAVSSSLKQNLELKFNLTFDVIPNMVDVDFFTLTKRIKSESDYKILNIAHCLPIKQQRLLIEAFYKTFFDNRNVKLIIGGDGSELIKLKLLVSKLGIESRVIFKGSLNKIQVKKLMHEVDLFVLSSRSETFGVVLIEAMSCGLPCVSTSSGGPDSIIVSDSLGIICENNIEDLSKALKTAYDFNYNPITIRRYVDSKFSKEIFQNEICKIYTHVKC